MSALPEKATARFRARRSAGMALVAVSACAAGLPAIAAEQTAKGRAIEEVIVTAQKRAEALQDVPVPVTAIDASNLTTVNQLRVQDYYSSVPGLGFTLAGNGSEPVVVIRGISSGGSGLGGNPTVGVVVDEVSYGSSAATGAQIPTLPDIDPGDLAHVEVLRGPQGTLYGASSIGGLIKFVTVDPSTDRFAARVQVGSASVSDSDDLGYAVRGSLNVPLSDTFAIRASAFTTRDAGYVDNAETGEEDANRRESEGGRLAALWEPSDAFSLKLSALYQDAKRLGADDVDTALGGDPAQAYLRGSGVYHRTSESYTATAIANVGRVELTSATGYSVDKLFDSVDLTRAFGGLLSDFSQLFFGVPRPVTGSDNETTKFTQELRAVVPLGDRVDWLIGAVYTEEETTSINPTYAADDNGVIAGQLANFIYPGSKYEEFAAFTNVTFDITERWDLQLGGRFSDHEQAYPTIRQGAFFGPDPLVSPSNSSKDEALTYLVTPRFKITPDLMFYARFASGYRPGGPNVLCGNPDVPCAFEPDETENYDIGLKGSLADGAVTFDASVFYIDWHNLQLVGVISPDGLSQYTTNASRAESKGIELSMEGQLTSGLSVSGWVSYNQAELTEDLPPVGALTGQRGDRLPYGSKVSGNLSLRQEFPVGSGATGFVGGMVSYVGDRVGDFQPDAARQEYPSYTQVDLRAGVSWETWNVDIFANNVTDKQGVLRTGLDSVFEPTYTIYIQPRTLGLSLTKSF